MKIDHSLITIPRNYVLVLPDHEFTHFHLNGRESLAAGKVSLENVAEHYSIRGKVFAVPNELVFNLTQIKNNKIPVAPMLDFEQTMFYFKSQQMETEGYKQGSVAFDVPMQVSPGDTVYFNYQEHYNCYDHGRWVDTVEHGEMLLMKYDQLICCHPAKDPNNLTMLNGYLFVEPIGIETLFGKNVFERAGIVIAKLKGQEMDFKKKLNIGWMRAWGTPVRNYIDFPDNNDGDYPFTDGQVVMYSPRVAPTLEFSLHKTHFDGKHLVKLRRRDLFAILPLDLTEGLVIDLVTTINMN